MSEHVTSKELFPCPFCGSDAIERTRATKAAQAPWHHESDSSDDVETIVYAVACRSCTAKVETTEGRQSAVIRWNRRMNGPPTAWHNDPNLKPRVLWWPSLDDGAAHEPPAAHTEHAVIAQHDETGRFWTGPRDGLPPGYSEVSPAGTYVASYMPSEPATGREWAVKFRKMAEGASEGYALGMTDAAKLIEGAAPPPTVREVFQPLPLDEAKALGDYIGESTTPPPGAVRKRTFWSPDRQHLVTITVGDEIVAFDDNGKVWEVANNA